jgi:arginase family enzyme
MENKIIFFGCSLDCDEREEAVQEKLEVMEHMSPLADPYEGIMALVRQEVDPLIWQEKGPMEIPSWLSPLPSPADRTQITVETFVSFLDQDGCRPYSDRVGKTIAENIFPHIPCLIGVDHSLTGGAFKKLQELIAPEEISLIILDSHTDALAVSLLAEAIQYDLESNPDSLHDPSDPFLYNRPDSYNASSFLDHLLAEGVVKPQNLYLLGIGDYPPKQAFRIKDRRIKNYVNRFLSLRNQGVTLLTKHDLLLNASKVKSIFKQIQTPWIYISIDLDIGARNALEGVRFLDRQGLNERQLQHLIGLLGGLLDRGLRLAGMDLTEINARKAGLPLTSGLDPTYRIGADIIKKLSLSL